MPDDASDEADLKVPYWLTSTEEAASTPFLQLLRRLPRLREAWLLGWRASPRTAVVMERARDRGIDAAQLLVDGEAA